MIPIILFNNNRLTTTQNLCTQLQGLGYDNIFILDLGSTYPPLLDWYETLTDITVLNHTNTGSMTFWDDNIISIFSDSPWVAISDSDISLNVDAAPGFIERMTRMAGWYGVDKVGLAIDYLDISNAFLADIIQPIEANYWLTEIAPDVYSAPIDTSFCVVRTDLPFQYDAVRVANGFTCTHTPWNTDWTDMTTEEQYFLDNADATYSTYKQHYLAWLALQG